jgi:putative ABC transport system permease protein
MLQVSRQGGILGVLESSTEEAGLKLYHLLLKDILRRKKRVLYAALGIVIAAMTVVGILTIAQAGQARIYNQLEKYGANLNIVPAINNVDVKLGDLSLGAVTVGDNYIPESKIPEIRTIADSKIRAALGIKDEGNIATIAPQLFVNTPIKGTSPTLLVAGIDPAEEHKIKTWWQVTDGEYLGTGQQAMLGAQAAQVLKVSVGDTVSLGGTDVTVVGILDETGSADDYQAFVPLATLQKAFGKEGIVSTIDVRALCNACPVEIIADAINQNITGVRAVAVKQVAATEMGMIDKMNKFMLALAGITLVIGAFGVVNTMMTSVHERIKDIGIMRAVGASRAQIVKAFIYEAVVIGLVGGIVGYGLGTLVAYGVGPLVFEGTAITVVPKYLPVSLVLAILVAVVATAYPALRATRVRVADSFRSL